ncbi:biotin--[acetyl-CoA-carboxylase] ligase [Sedimentibacter sp. zth1]|uniref:biotin--[acetyl-CoA-carboxylase] ligase n=1 Tax=Sedimentibacter sp. zth1 TaxID=2816908 RepID=UPI001A91B71E|nr:biotin--[acetyl-CoA-carboxylase] ligase [Sedimentibacter sp. zth1]QSX07022.1 biotin--[acetyl-CoA-carboxylase] ligase [Sedimentibacter sp. zth1]
MKDKIIDLLKNSNNEFVSGEEISKHLGVTRAAIWKHINALKESGYKIESVSKKGYRLIGCPDILTYEEIKEHLTTKFIGRNIIHFDNLDSTNTYAKSIADTLVGEGHAIITEKQLNGRGRLGRQWISQNSKGIWMSLILRPELDIFEVSKVTQVAAAAVNMAFRDIGVESKIKWPNDIIINDKKVCGILTEMNSEINIINYIVVGIGINVNNDLDDFSSEISDIATSIKIESKKYIKRNELVAKIFNNFEILYNDFVDKKFSTALNICKDNSYVLNKDINIIKNGEVTSAKAIDINERGELVVKYENGSIDKVLSGEVSVRIKKN